VRFPEQLLTALRPRTPQVTVGMALLRLAEHSGACAPGRGKGVAAAAVMLGRGFGMRSGRVAALADAARLLDIGLVGMPLHVAQRSQPLTTDEEDEFERHPLRGLEVARDVGLTYEQLNGIVHHHERYDGCGYPMGLAGGEIPEFARILAIADAYDRMTRPAHAGVAISADDAVIELRTAAGSHFDPALVDAFDHAVARQRGAS
jgi:HD-GYP domain-containing protein (c-di-GMP phosphodiesterase class II)